MSFEIDSADTNDRDLYDLAVNAWSKKEANSHFAMLVQRQFNRGVSAEIAANFIRTNLARYAAHGDDEMRERVERLYECAHPIFGAFKEFGAPKTEEIYQLGLNKGKGEGPQTLAGLRKIKR
jgi:hypothetical protein